MNTTFHAWVDFAKAHALTSTLLSTAASKLCRAARTEGGSSAGKQLHFLLCCCIALLPPPPPPAAIDSDALAPRAADVLVLFIYGRGLTKGKAAGTAFGRDPPTAAAAAAAAPATHRCTAVHGDLMAATPAAAGL